MSVNIMAKWLFIVLLFLLSGLFLLDVCKSNVKHNTTIIHELSINDASQLMDLQNFTFLINHENTCKSKDVLVMTLVHSAPHHFEHRNLIRRMFDKEKQESPVLFLVGTSKQFNEKLVDENYLYQDIVQGNFIDDYKNLTYKYTMALKWMTYFCPNASFFLKIDDDVFVRQQYLLNYIKKDIKVSRNVIGCQYNLQPLVHRRFSKWAVTREEYSSDYYPNYCNGYMNLLSIDAVFSLYIEAQASKFFWIDDVLITGDLRKKLKINLLDLSPLILTYSMLRHHSTRQILRQNFIFGPSDLRLEDIKECIKLFI